MGYNAGGYGTMTFPDAASVSRWKKATVSHAAHEWLPELDAPYAPEETVEKRLARIAKGHDVRRICIQQISIDGPKVTLTWDTGEDGFRDEVSDFAALVRSADAFGAKGTFYFLGTAGAEGDFAYSLVLDGKGSRVSEVPAKTIEKVAYGPDYDAYTQRVTALVMAGDPKAKKLMESLFQGEPPRAKGGGLHEQVVAALAGFSDAQLAKAAARFPELVPNGTNGVAQAKDLFKQKTVRAQFATPANEETRAVALFTLGLLDKDTAIQLALEVLHEKPAGKLTTAAALHVLAKATHAEGEVALDYAAEHLAKGANPYVLHGAQMVFIHSVYGGYDATVTRLLDKLDAARGTYLILALARRRKKSTSLAPAVKRYAKRTRDPNAVKLLAKWKV